MMQYTLLVSMFAISFTLFDIILSEMNTRSRRLKIAGKIPLSKEPTSDHSRRECHIPPIASEVENKQSSPVENSTKYQKVKPEKDGGDFSSEKKYRASKYGRKMENATKWHRV